MSDPSHNTAVARNAFLTRRQPIRPAQFFICDDPSRNDGTCSPIVISLGQGPYRLSGADDPEDFDVDADGLANRITWTARESAVAFLAMDRNNNGRIDDGSELFGDATPLGSGGTAANGFEVLAELDANDDGLVDVADTDWTRLLLWVHENHDGLSQSEEIQPIALSAIQAIETGYHWTGRRDSLGNLFRYKGTAHLDRGRRPIYDVYFRTAE